MSLEINLHMFHCSKQSALFDSVLFHSLVCIENCI